MRRSEKNGRKEKREKRKKKHADMPRTDPGLHAWNVCSILMVKKGNEKQKKHTSGSFLKF